MWLIYSINSSLYQKRHFKEKSAEKILKNLLPYLEGVNRQWDTRGLVMKQSSLDLNLSTKKSRKNELLAQIDRVVPSGTSGPSEASEKLSAATHPLVF